MRHDNYLLGFRKLGNGRNKPSELTTFFPPVERSGRPTRAPGIHQGFALRSRGRWPNAIECLKMNNSRARAWRSSERDLSDKNQSAVSQRKGSGLTHHSRPVGVDRDPFDGNLHSRLWNGQLAASGRPQASTKAGGSVRRSQKNESFMAKTFDLSSASQSLWSANRCYQLIKLMLCCGFVMGKERKEKK